MSSVDPHRISDKLDEATIQRLIDRLESRAKDVVFTRLFDNYINKLDFPSSSRVLEVGCGTGAMTRALVKKKNLTHRVVGVDQSAAFVEAAMRFAVNDGLQDRIEFIVGDSHRLDFEEQSFDVVIAHTVISHVSEPEVAIREFARVLKKGGILVIFDGDYASLTFSYPDDHGFGREMDHALATTTFNNPLVMRDIIRLLPELDLELTDTMVEVVSEIGHSSYFRSFAETYAPMVADGGLLPKHAVVEWLDKQKDRMRDGTFFASCNYYTYLFRRP